MKVPNAPLRSGRVKSPGGIALGVVYILSIGLLQGQSLQDLIQEAQDNNPKIQAYELRYSIAREKVNEGGSLPDTELGAGLFVSEPETRTGAQKARFSVRQMLPWFGTITARKEYAGAMAEAEYEELALIRRRLIMEVSQGYYRLYASMELQQVLEANLRLLETYERQALTAVEVGRASVVDVLRLQIRQNQLMERSKVLQQEISAQEAVLNALLNSAPDEGPVVADTLFIPTEDPEGTAGIGAHPELLKYDRLYESVTQAELLNQKEGAPSLGVGLDYVPVQERAGMNFSDNGKDIIMPMISFSVPVFNQVYRSRTRQNALKQEEINAMKQERENTLKASLAAAVAERNAARISFETQSVNLESAKNAESILIRNYETGTLDFNELLEIQELQLNFQIKRIEAIHRYYANSAIINYLSGP